MKKLILVVGVLTLLAILPWWIARNALSTQLNWLKDSLALQQLSFDYHSINVNVLTPKLSVNTLTLGDSTSAQALTASSFSLTGYNALLPPETLVLTLDDLQLDGALGNALLGPLQKNKSHIETVVAFDLQAQSARLNIKIKTDQLATVNASLVLAQTNALYNVLWRYHEAYQTFGAIHLMPLSEQLALESDKITALSVVEPKTLTVELVNHGEFDLLLSHWATVNKLTLAEFQGALAMQFHSLPIPQLMQQTLVDSINLPTKSLTFSARLAEGTRILDLQSAETLTAFSDPQRWTQLFNVSLERQ